MRHCRHQHQFEGPRETFCNAMLASHVTLLLLSEPCGVQEFANKSADTVALPEYVKLQGCDCVLEISAAEKN